VKIAKIKLKTFEISMKKKQLLYRVRFRM
jgi:hypothetical protein